MSSPDLKKDAIHDLKCVDGPLVRIAIVWNSTTDEISVNTNLQRIIASLGMMQRAKMLMSDADKSKTKITGETPVIMFPGPKGSQ